MKTYAEYLKSMGASEDDLKVLDTPIARKAWEKQQSDLEAATRDRDAAKSAQANWDKWYQETLTPDYQRLERESIAAKANEARAVTALKAAQERGLLDVAKDLGYDISKPAEPAASAVPNFDSSKYMTKDETLSIADRAGDAIAVAQDIAFEHTRLFPDKPLNFRELRNEAKAAGKPVEQFWQDRYGVAAARQARADKEKAEYEARLRKEGADAESARLSSLYGNPDTRPLSTSTSSFTPRTEGMRGGKQPWDVPGGDNALDSDRVSRATQKVIKQAIQ